ncbi:hypothetical protein OHC33_002678 [Knufia fluminis]|uniref:Uncharacterized protein n=1 Tax=Knufia fluminis TaxID=191047 RepID=A0AAN8IAW1_9EURO|nr:hypothetical protein OHC33_002678 [Knufia fluminis]
MNPEEGVAFLLTCIESQKWPMKFVDPGRALGLSSQTARARYERLKRTVESGGWPPAKTAKLVQSRMIHPAVHHYLLQQERNLHRPLSKFKQEKLNAEVIMKHMNVPASELDRGFVEVFNQGDNSDVEVLEVDEEPPPLIPSSRNVKRKASVATLGDAPTGNSKRRSMEKQRLKRAEEALDKSGRAVSSSDDDHADINEQDDMPCQTESIPDSEDDVEIELVKLGPASLQRLLHPKQWQKSPAASTRNQHRWSPPKRGKATSTRPSSGRKKRPKARRACDECKRTRNKCTHGENDPNSKLYASYGYQPPPAHSSDDDSGGWGIDLEEEKKEGGEQDVEVLDLC